MIFPLRLASISERLASLFVSQGEEVEEEEGGQKGGAERRGSYLEYDMEGIVGGENAMSEEAIKTKQVTGESLDAFIDSFPILNTPLPLPPIQSKEEIARSRVSGHIPHALSLILDPETPQIKPTKVLSTKSPRPTILEPTTPPSYDKLDSSNPNWLPGLPKPPPGVVVEPPRNRSKVARIRYLAQLNRLVRSMSQLISGLLIFQFGEEERRA